MLRLIYFECRQCKAVKTIETIGEVVAGPWCDSCRRPMERKNVEQTMLFKAI